MELSSWIGLALLTINVAATIFVARSSTHVAKWKFYAFIWAFPILGAILSVPTVSKTTITPDGPDWTAIGNANGGLAHADDVLDGLSDSH